MILNSRTLALVLGLAAGLLGTGAAEAHPHVFAESRMEIVGTPDGRLDAVRNVWRMDELFSSTVLMDFDANADGVLDSAELTEVASTVHASIAEWSFYTFVRADGRLVEMSAPEEIRAMFEDGQLLMFFEMKAGEPVDLAAQKLTFSNFDDTFFVAFDFAGEDAFQLVDMPDGCSKSLVVPDPDAAARQWMDSIAALGPDETVPDDGVDYSQILATRIEVRCG